MPTESFRTYLPDLDLMTNAGLPAVYHCHHFNLFLDQTVDDALGPEEGGKLRFVAAREASHAFLRALCVRQGALTPVEKLAAAMEAFSAMGHGRLEISADGNGGTVQGEFLHYGYSWSQKYGQRVRRRHPADAFAAGYAAAAVEVAYGLERETMVATETQCVAMRAETCRFELKKGPQAPALPPIREAEMKAAAKPTLTGQHEAEIAKIASGLRTFSGSITGDERGLIQAFGVFITMHLSAYYNRITYDTMGHIEKTSPGSIGVLEELFRESGHVCVFNTFGGILQSPEWAAMVGPHDGDVTQTIIGGIAIARALGFGRWVIHELVPGSRLVVRAPCTYESTYFIPRHGTASKPNEYFLQGACLAICQLAYRVDWKSKPALTPEFYEALFRGKMPCKVEQTQGTTMGQPYSEILVTQVA